MPEKSQTISANGYNAASLLAIAYGAFEKLNWNIKYAGENILVAYTPRSMSKWDMEITAQAADDQLTVTSKMIHGEAFDMMGRNQKNINQFALEFESVKAAASESSLQQWTEKINVLMQYTAKAAEEEIKQAAETDKVMNLSSGNMYVTYGIIAINVLMFIAMVINGAGLFEPNGIVHIKWGSNYTPFTYSGDWWRLLTSNYIHFGIIHLALNMYALYNLGMFLEPMMGKTRYLAAYTCSGVLASLVSLWWHKEGVNSAGASGAIFGMIGLLLAFIVTKYIPATIRQGLLQSVGIMAVYSLVYGMKGGVDNAAHIGGLIAGFIIGWLFWLTMKKEGKPLPVNLVSAIVIALTAGASFFLLQNKAVSKTEREKAEQTIINEGYADSKKFITKYNEFVELQDKAMAVFKDTTLSADEFKRAAKEVSYPSWDKAAALLDEMDKLNVSATDHQKTGLLKKYTELRKEELRLREEGTAGFTGDILLKLTNNGKAIDSIMGIFSKLQSPD